MPASRDADPQDTSSADARGEADPSFDPAGGSPKRMLIVTIDGPAGTGKSSVAGDLAKRLGLELLDTGAMYRAAAVIAIENGYDIAALTAPVTDNADAAALDAMHDQLARDVRDADIRFDWTTHPPTLRAGGRALTTRLRDADVSRAVSPVSSIAAVRRVLVERQRRIGEAHPRLVSEGRDQGSVVFADADVKFYLDATARVRARRRQEQMIAEGRSAPELAAIEAEIIDRDRRDSSRAVGPLRMPQDAERIETDRLDRTQVVDRLEAVVRERTGWSWGPKLPVAAGASS